MNEKGIDSQSTTKKWTIMVALPPKLRLIRYLLNKFASEFGLSHLEGKQKVQGQRSGTEWEIDGKGVRDGNEGFVIVECRRYTTSKQSQEKVAGLAYRILDAGAGGGILVSPMGLQEGAKKMVGAEGIIEVQLNQNSTPYEYFLRFLNNVMVGVHETVQISENIVVVVKRSDDVSCERHITSPSRRR